VNRCDHVQACPCVIVIKKHGEVQCTGAHKRQLMAACLYLPLPPVSYTKVSLGKSDCAIVSLCLPWPSVSSARTHRTRKKNEAACTGRQGMDSSSAPKRRVRCSQEPKSPSRHAWEARQLTRGRQGMCSSWALKLSRCPAFTEDARVPACNPGSAWHACTCRAMQ